MQSLRSRVVLGIVAALVLLWALSGLGAIDVGDLLGDRDALRLVVDDESGDCRMAGRDWGEGCDPAADISWVSAWRTGRQVLMVEIELEEAPPLGSDLEWTADFFAETANAFTDNGLICGLSNVSEAGEPTAVAAAYALEFRFSSERLGSAACDGWLDGSTARFRVDVSGQPVDKELRLVGSVKLEYPQDPDHLGSEDDFLVKTTLADLPR